MPMTNHQSIATRLHDLAERAGNEDIAWEQWNQVDSMNEPLRTLESLMTEIEGLDRARKTRRPVATPEPEPEPEGEDLEEETEESA